MENFLRSKEYWGLVENGIKEPKKDEVLTEVQLKNLEADKLKDLKAKNYLFQAIDRAILETILKKDTTKTYGTLSRRNTKAQPKLSVLNCKLFTRSLKSFT